MPAHLNTASFKKVYIPKFIYNYMYVYVPHCAGWWCSLAELVLLSLHCSRLDHIHSQHSKQWTLPSFVIQ